MSAPEPDEPGSDSSAYRAAGPYLTLGIQLAATIVVLFFVGRYLDARLSTTPWLMIAALFIGCTGGLIKFIHTVNVLTRQEDERAGKKN